MCVPLPVCFQSFTESVFSANGALAFRRGSATIGNKMNAKTVHLNESSLVAIAHFTVPEWEASVKSAFAILAENKNFVALTVALVLGDATRRVIRLMNKTPIVRMVANRRE